MYIYIYIGLIISASARRSDPRDFAKNDIKNPEVCQILTIYGIGRGCLRHSNNLHSSISLSLWAKKRERKRGAIYFILRNLEQILDAAICPCCVHGPNAIPTEKRSLAPAASDSLESACRSLLYERIAINSRDVYWQ